MTRNLRQSRPIVSRLCQDHGPTSFTIMSLAIQYAHELGYRLEGETVAPCEVPNGLAQNMTFFGACITQKYFWFEDMYRWYVFFREHGIEPESIAEYASQQLASRDAWRLFVHSVYRPGMRSTADLLEDLFTCGGAGAVVQLAPLLPPLCQRDGRVGRVGRVRRGLGEQRGVEAPRVEIRMGTALARHHLCVGYM